MSVTVPDRPGAVTGGARAWVVLIANTLAFTVCFAAWVLYGVLVTFLVDRGVFSWTASQIGILIGAPVLTGAVMRLPVGILCDLVGGRIVFTTLMVVAAVPMFLVASATSYAEFLAAGLWFGVAGAAFAAGVAYTSLWFPATRVGMALGIFGAGNVGAALTSMFGPLLLTKLTAERIEGWQTLPRLYAGLLLVTAVLFWFVTTTRKPPRGAQLTMAVRLAPLRHSRVWRFGLYYSFYFGGFVALSQWLIPYYLNVYSMSVATAGLVAALFSLPSGLLRAVGGWMSDRWGARRVMYATLIPGLLLCVLLIPAAMVIQTPGQGITADRDGVVASVSRESITFASGTRYVLTAVDVASLPGFTADRHLIFPHVSRWQEPTVHPGDSIRKGELLARGTTRVFFQANRLVFTALVFLLGCTMGIGMAAVFKHIPTYFPGQVGVVGGLVGVLGGIGGFAFPIIFGSLLQITGIWTTNWMFLALLAGGCLTWMQFAIGRMMRSEVPEMMRLVEGVKS